METPLFDERYIAGLQKGDPQIQTHFVKFFEKPSWAKAYKQLRSPERADDVVQETLMRVLRYFRSGKDLDDPERLPGFVRMTCHNVILEMLREKIRNPPAPDPDCDILDFHWDPEKQTVTEERKRIVRRILSGLPARDRELLKSAWIEEKDTCELCARFGVEPDYLRVQMFRARRKFLEALLKAGYKWENLNPGPG